MYPSENNPAPQAITGKSLCHVVLGFAFSTIVADGVSLETEAILAESPRIVDISIFGNIRRKLWKQLRHGVENILKRNSRIPAEEMLAWYICILTWTTTRWHRH